MVPIPLGPASRFSGLSGGFRGRVALCAFTCAPCSRDDRNAQRQRSGSDFDASSFSAAVKPGFDGAVTASQQYGVERNSGCGGGLSPGHQRSFCRNLLRCSPVPSRSCRAIVTTPPCFPCSAPFSPDRPSRRGASGGRLAATAAKAVNCIARDQPHPFELYTGLRDRRLADSWRLVQPAIAKTLAFPRTGV